MSGTTPARSGPPGVRQLAYVTWLAGPRHAIHDGALFCSDQWRLLLLLTCRQSGIDFDGQRLHMTAAQRRSSTRLWRDLMACHGAVSG